MREARRQYYHHYNIGWVAHPPHEKDGFLHAGNFRKGDSLEKPCLNQGSNMNFAMKMGEQP
jgi:hypothetical protein